MPDLTPEARKRGIERTQRYVWLLLPKLRLQHWQVKIEDEPPDADDASAAVHMNPSDWRALIYLSDYFIASPPARQRLHLTHELIHLYFRGIDTHHAALAHHFGTGAWGAISDRYTHEEELAIDGLACAIAPFLPMPPEEENDETGATPDPQAAPHPPVDTTDDI